MSEASEPARGRRRAAWTAGLAAAVTGLLLGAAVAAAPPVSPESAVRLRAEAALLVDLVSGEVLFSKNAEAPLAPASLTKLMTIYLALEDVAEGRVGLDDEVTVSVRAARTRSSRVPLRAGERVPLGKLLAALAVISANDASVAVAEYLEGTEEAFVARMNRRAADLGLTETHFSNAHGLPSPTQRSSAADMAALALRLFDDYPLALDFLSRRTFHHRNMTRMRSLGGIERAYAIECLKTAWTRDAGFSLVATARQEDRHLLLVVLKARNRYQRELAARTLLRYGFARAARPDPNGAATAAAPPPTQLTPPSLLQENGAPN
ncbi:MAG: D-alanyl-D-alanine carboxypeptidase [candidate division NC10 bacterium]|nr:D-alanyl-D-alanine carboxypeptidase [candidate division NC10 bacterium]